MGSGDVEGLIYDLYPLSNIEFFEYLVDMALHGLFADIQLSSNLLVAKTLPDHLKDSDLLGSQVLGEIRY